MVLRARLTPGEIASLVRESRRLRVACCLWLGMLRANTQSARLDLRPTDGRVEVGQCSDVVFVVLPRITLLELDEAVVQLISEGVD